MSQVAFQPTKFILFQGQVWARGADGNFYLYGGATNDVYDSCQATVTIPFMDIKEPATVKNAMAIDADITGTWTVSVTSNWINGQYIVVSNGATQATFDQGFIAYSAQGTHYSLQFQTTSALQAVVSEAIIHFAEAEKPVD
jgi:hypothetical protein